MVNRAAGVTYLTHSHSHMDDGERQSEQDSFICTAGVKRGKFLDNFNLEETALKYLVTCGFHKTLHFLFYYYLVFCTTISIQPSGNFCMNYLIFQEETLMWRHIRVISI